MKFDPGIDIHPVADPMGFVYGHGVFTIGRKGFAEAFRAMVEVENWCRSEYRRLLEEKTASIR